MFLRSHFGFCLLHHCKQWNLHFAEQNLFLYQLRFDWSQDQFNLYQHEVGVYKLELQTEGLLYQPSRSHLYTIFSLSSTLIFTFIYISTITFIIFIYHFLFRFKFFLFYNFFFISNFISFPFLKSFTSLSKPISVSPFSRILTKIMSNSINNLIII